MTRVLPVVLSFLVTLSAMAQSADLRATITSAPDAVRPGDEVIFTAEVENLGPDATENVYLTLYYAATVCREGFHLGPMQPGEKRSFTCNGPTPPSPPYFAFHAQVRVTSATPDPNPENDADLRLIRILTPPDLFIFTNTQGRRIPGLPFTTVIRYGNRAPVNATGGVITITSPTPIVKAPDFCTITGTVARCAVGTITSGFIDFDVETIAPETNATPIPIVLEISANEAEHAPDDNRYVTQYNVTFTTFFVTNTADSGSGSLRAAIEEANGQCRDPKLQCVIAFRIPGDAPQQVIPLQGPLPYIMAYNMIVDGGTQRGFFGNRVTLRGDALTAGDALVVSTSCELIVRDLTIEDFPGVAIAALQLEPCQGMFFETRRIENNLVRRNGRGIWVDRPAITIVKNEIRDHERSGVYVTRGQAAISENTITGNGASGIYIAALGAGSDIRENTISGNAHFGVAIDRTATNVSVNRNLIYGNSEMPIDYGLDGLSTVEPVPPPQITNVRDEGGETVIEATSTAGGTFSPLIEVFASDAPHPRGFAEARQFVGTALYDPLARVWILRAKADLRGKWIAATATRTIFTGWARAPRADGISGGDFFTTTSELSPPIAVK